MDAVLIGALRGHFLADPAPRRALERLERVREWAEDADRWDGAGRPLPFPERTEFADIVLERMAGSYRSWLLAHAAALDRGERVFTAEVAGHSVQFRTLRPPDPVSSRDYLVDRVCGELSVEQRSVVAAWLDEIGLGEVFPIDAGATGVKASGS